MDFLASYWWVFGLGCAFFALATIVTGLMNFGHAASVGISSVQDILAAANDEEAEERVHKAIATGKKTASRWY